MYIVYIIYYILYIVYYILYIIYYILYIEYNILYIIYFILYIIYHIKYYILYIILYILYSILYIILYIKLYIILYYIISLQHACFGIRNNNHVGVAFWVCIFVFCGDSIVSWRCQDTHGRFAVELWRFCGGIIEVLSCISGGFEIGLLWFCGGIMRWDYGGFVMVSHELPRHDHHASGLNQQLVQCHVGPPR